MAVSFLHPPCGVIRLGGKRLCQLGHLTGPLTFLQKLPSHQHPLARLPSLVGGIKTPVQRGPHSRLSS